MIFKKYIIDIKRSKRKQYDLFYPLFILTILANTESGAGILRTISFICGLLWAHVLMAQSILQVKSAETTATLSKEGFVVLSYDIVNTTEPAIQIDKIEPWVSNSNDLTATIESQTCRKPLAPQSTCAVTIKVKALGTVGQVSTGVQVCGFNGALCSGLKKDIEVTSYEHPCDVASDKAICLRLEKILNKAFRHHQGPGAQLLVNTPRYGTIQLAAGLADMAKPQRKMLLSDTLRIASITKTFVAVAILKFIDMNKIALDEKVSQLLNGIDFSRLPNGNTVTIRQLLNMTSGIPDYIDLPQHNSRVDDANYHWQAKKTIKLLYDKSALFSPGSQYHYSNTNYVILGLLLEQLGKDNLDNVLSNLIFTPLHMNQTFQSLNMPDKRLSARGYVYDRDLKKLIDITDENDGNNMGDGGMISTVSDLHKFIKALLISKTLLPKRLLREMKRQYFDEYGLGLFNIDTDYGDCLGHTGGTSGFLSEMCYLKEEKLTHILLFNNEESDTMETVLNQVAKVLLG